MPPDFRNCRFPFSLKTNFLFRPKALRCNEENLMRRIGTPKINSNQESKCLLWVCRKENRQTAKSLSVTHLEA